MEKQIMLICTYLNKGVLVQLTIDVQIQMFKVKHNQSFQIVDMVLNSEQVHSVPATVQVQLENCSNCLLMQYTNKCLWLNRAV